MRWRVLGGYGVRNFDRADLGSVATSLLEAQAQWLATHRLTLPETASNTIDDELGSDDNGRIETIGNVTADYEIRHDLFVGVHAGFTRADFIGSSREDDIMKAGVTLDYYYTKNMLFTLGYTYENRDSNDADFDMDRSQVRIGGTLKF